MLDHGTRSHAGSPGAPESEPVCARNILEVFAKRGRLEQRAVPVLGNTSGSLDTCGVLGAARPAGWERGNTQGQTGCVPGCVAALPDAKLHGVHERRNRRRYWGKSLADTDIEEAALGTPRRFESACGAGATVRTESGMYQCAATTECGSR